jgi:hypothetical protein
MGARVHSGFARLVVGAGVSGNLRPLGTHVSEGVTMALLSIALTLAASSSAKWVERRTSWGR